jgi:hypothetical protein
MNPAIIAIILTLQLIVSATSDVMVFDVRDPPSPGSSSDIRQAEPEFEHTSAHSGAMPLARLLVSVICLTILIQFTNRVFLISILARIEFRIEL